MYFSIVFVPAAHENSFGNSFWAELHVEPSATICASASDNIYWLDLFAARNCLSLTGGKHILLTSQIENFGGCRQELKWARTTQTKKMYASETTIRLSSNLKNKNWNFGAIKFFSFHSRFGTSSTNCCRTSTGFSLGRIIRSLERIAGLLKTLKNFISRRENGFASEANETVMILVGRKTQAVLGLEIKTQHF